MVKLNNIFWRCRVRAWLEPAIIVTVLSFMCQDVATGSPAFVQQKNNRIATGNTVAVTPAITTQGNLIVIYAVWDNTGTISLNDTVGNKYVSAAGPTRWDGNNFSAQVFYAQNIKGGADTITATLGVAANSFAEIYVLEYSG